MLIGHDEYWMRQALQLARQAEQCGEVPVGAILVKDGQCIAKAGNQPITACDPTAHAEIVALRQGAEVLANYRLIDTTMYVTLEPCVMCAGALVHARVKRLVYAAHDPRTGACGSVFSIACHTALNHRLQVTGGILAEQSAALLQAFFQQRRSPRAS